MDAMGVGDKPGKSPFSERFKKKLHYWFVQYNPLYFFSAFCVLLGVFLISQGLEELGWKNGPLFDPAGRLGTDRSSENTENGNRHVGGLLCFPPHHLDRIVPDLIYTCTNCALFPPLVPCKA